MWLLSSTSIDLIAATYFKKKCTIPQKSCYLPFQVVDKHTFDILLCVLVTYYKLEAFYSL